MKKKGFALIELILMLAVIAMISTAGTVIFSRASKKAAQNNNSNANISNPNAIRVTNNAPRSRLFSGSDGVSDIAPYVTTTLMNTKGDSLNIPDRDFSGNKVSIVHSEATITTTDRDTCKELTKELKEKGSVSDSCFNGNGSLTFKHINM